MQGWEGGEEEEERAVTSQFSKLHPPLMLHSHLSLVRSADQCNIIMNIHLTIFKLSASFPNMMHSHYTVILTHFLHNRKN
jgi:hypothetical protein